MLSTPSLPCQADQDQAPNENLYVSKSHGFRIERPDETWIFQEDVDSSARSLALIIKPKTSDSRVQVSVRVKPLDSFLDAVTIRDRILKWIEDKSEYTKSKAAIFETGGWISGSAGRKTPGLTVEMEAYGETFRLRQCYLVGGGFQYTLQCHAPAGEFESHASAFERIWKTFALTQVSEETKKDQELHALAAKCGSEIAWVEDWEKAAAQARDEKKLVMVLVRFLPGFKISDEASAGPFMDPDVVGLVQERFVALRFIKGMEAPFVPQESYGMGPNTFGTSLLLVTPDGEVVGDCSSIVAVSIHDFLLDHLLKHPGLDGPSSPGGRKGIELAEWHLRRGELEKASRILKKTASGRGHRLKASLFRRLRKGDDALKELKKAHKTTGARDLEADLAVDKAVILLRTKRFDEALKLLTRILEEYPESERIPEATYWLGACRLRLGAKDDAAALWRSLTESHGKNRWAWKAAAALTGTPFALGLGERLAWPDEDILNLLDTPEPEKLEFSKVRRAEKDAFEFLLRHQRSDGSWISPSEAGRALSEIPNEFTEAITAICARSLVPFRRNPSAARAVRRAADYLLDARERRKKTGDTAYFMDYTVWSKAFTLWFLADCIDTNLVKRKKLESIMDEIVSEIGLKQKKGGGWSYYVTTDLRNSDKPSNQSISFVTAAVLIALLEAGEAGISVPEEMTNGALGCLERMHNENGTFEYFLFHDHENLPRKTAIPGAAGRGPLCSQALFRGGRGDLDGIRRSLDIFMEHRHTYAREQGKSLMHAGLHGQGSHYLMFDYAFAASAIRLLPKKERARYRDPVLKLILDARSEGGSYLDNPLIGRHYGTGMALIALRSLHPLPEPG